MLYYQLNREGGNMKSPIRFRIFILLMILSSLFLVAFQAGDFGSIEDLLVWIAVGGGSMVLAGAVVALLFENWKAWHTFPRPVKLAVPIILAGVFGIGAQLLLALEVPALIPPAYSSVLLIMLNWIAGQWQYMKVKDGVYANSAKFH